MVNRQQEQQGLSSQSRLRVATYNIWGRHGEWMARRAVLRGRRIDQILVRCSDHGPTLDVVACDHFLEEPVNGIWASDHFGIVADFTLPTSVIY